MASPQTRNLKTANGGKVAPQHYNDAMQDFEYSKGSDGALHTKVVNQPSVTLIDKNGNPFDSGNKLPVDVTFPTEQAVKDDAVLTKLADIEAKIQATNDRLNKTLNTQLTGSKALQTKEITIFDQLAITDTNPHYYGGGSFLAIPNFNDYNERILMVRNSHDQPVKIDIVSNMRLVDTLVYGVSQKNQSITIPANGAFKPTLITSDDLESLGKIFSYDVSIRITATALPTTGSITIKLKMVSK